MHRSGGSDWPATWKVNEIKANEGFGRDRELGFSETVLITEAGHEVPADVEQNLFVIK